MTRTSAKQHMYHKYELFSTHRIQINLTLKLAGKRTEFGAILKNLRDPFHYYQHGEAREESMQNRQQ